MASKLPDNLVKRPPVFDNPLRATSALALVDDVPASSKSSTREQGALVPSTGGAPLPSPEDALSPDAVDPLVHRFTVRLTDEQWKALHTECHLRRMRGANTNPAELLRLLLNEWITRTP
jgi:hypothetical protein